MRVLAHCRVELKPLNPIDVAVYFPTSHIVNDSHASRMGVDDGRYVVDLICKDEVLVSIDAQVFLVLYFSETFI